MEIQRVSKTSNEPGRTYLGEVKRYATRDIPLFEVKDVFAFTKLIGHAKFINNQYSEVLYRGQSQLYFGNGDNQTQNQGQKPSAYRGDIHKDEVDARVEEQLKLLLEDNRLEDFVHFNKNYQGEAKYLWEAMLQHYEAKTRFLDVVDNHWIALWFACHRYDDKTRRYKRSKRDYSYVFVFALPTQSVTQNSGLLVNEQCIIADFRQACPSTVLRPHMQHAKLFALLDENKQYREDYACNLVCVIQIRTDLCLDWLGDTMLLTDESLFPCRYKDSMLNLIEVERKDIFDGVMTTLKARA